MTEPGQLLVNVVDGEIIVTLPSSTYGATYCKPADSSHLNLQDLSFEIDPRAPHVARGFLRLAWKLANDKARELGVDCLGPAFGAARTACLWLARHFQMVEVMSAVLRIRIWLSHRLLDLGFIEAARRLVPEVERYRFEMMVHQSIHRRGRFHDKPPR